MSKNSDKDFNELTKKNKFYYHKSAFVNNKSKIGENTKIWHFSHIQSNAVIGNNCIIGQNTFIGSNVKLGNNVKIQNNVSLYEGVKFADNVFCGPSVVFTNVTNPRAEVERKKEFKSTEVEKGVTLGANCTVLCGVKLREYSFIAAGAVVTKDTKPFELVAGIPAKRIGWISRYGERMNFNKNKKIFTCKFTKTKYKLKNNKIIITEAVGSIDKNE